ncbi:MAG: OmpA family protein [Loktanella sp.]|nr:OmpA family protein [Loktanella sp.]
MLKTWFDRLYPTRAGLGVVAATVIVAHAFPNESVAQTTQPQACQQLVAALASDGRVALDGVSFDFNRASLRPDSLPAMIAARDAILTLGGDWQIAGHTDDRGSRDYNQTLSEQRALAVRDWLIGSGVPAGRLSAAGFSFDQPVADNGTDEGRALNRRVELVGEVTPDMLGFGGPEGVDPCPDTLTAGTQDKVPPPPPIIEWTGNGGQEWLPFSFLMATGYGAATGWEGDRVTMPPGTQPQACQALCAAEAQCAAFSFEPAGSNFIETASCSLIGYGTEMDLWRNNSYLDGGVHYASGLKPDAMLLTPESEDIARSLLADLAEIAALRDSVRLTAPDTHAPETWMDVAVDGAVPADQYTSFIEITELGDYNFDWQKSQSALFVHDMQDGRQGQIWVPAAGDYVLRYAINHPTAGQHVIVEQSLHVPVGPGSATPAAQTEDDASLNFPMVVAPGETVPVTYTGPLFDGDWIDMIVRGNDNDMSGGLGWDWATGAPVTLIAPLEEGEYTLRYVAEDPQLGRVVLAHDSLVVRKEAVPVIDAADVAHRCEGAGLTPCELVLPEDDIALTLIPGYGITAPLVYVTAGGVAGDRAGFDVVRLSDGEVIVTVNARQTSAAYCQDGLAGDTICVSNAVTDADGIAAAFVIGSLTTAAMAAEIGAITEDEPGIAPGVLQGVWFASLNMPDTADHEAHFMMMELFQDDGDDAVYGYFVTATDIGPLRAASGDIAGRLLDGSLSLTLAAPDGTPLLNFTGEIIGDIDYFGAVTPASGDGDATGTRLTRVAGPGEDWDGPPWMTGQPDGMAAAMQIGQAALGDMLGDLDGEDRAMAEIMGALMGAVAGVGTEPAHAQGATSPNLAGLGAKTVDLQGIPADALVEMIVPFQEIAP